MANWMIQSGTRVVAGVSPGSGGKEVEGCPIFNSVAEAKARFPGITATCIVVPAPFALSAVTEALEAGIPCVYVITERVPIRDVMEMRRMASEKNAVIFGPSSVGYLQFPQFRLGYLGGQKPFEHLTEGGIALLSSSGGITNETLMAFARRGIGVRLALSVGGDVLNGCNLIEALESVQTRPDVTALAVFLEPGNPLISALIRGRVRPVKPLRLCLPGDALESLPRGLPYGHAGTVLGDDEGSLRDIREKLTAQGIPCTALHDEFIDWCAAL